MYVWFNNSDERKKTYNFTRVDTAMLEGNTNSVVAVLLAMYNICHVTSYHILTSIFTSDFHVEKETFFFFAHTLYAALTFNLLNVTNLLNNH